ncbi:MAG: hypothetical protein Q9193_004813 [Seirophora villosa]
MKSFIISAVMGIASFGLLFGNAAAAPTDAGKAPSSHLTSRLLHQADTSTAAVKRDAQGFCWEGPDGQIHCPVGKREAQGFCWIAADGQVHCPLDKREAQGFCTEGPDGQIHCPVGKREAQGFCTEGPDGQIHCPVEKRKAQGFCWIAADGQVHCPLDKREAQGLCWIAADGQVHCPLNKREAQPEVPAPKPVPRPFHNGTSTPCASWWALDKTSAEPSYCLNAMVFFGNITLETFRELNPDVNADCTNLKPWYAYCVRAAAPSRPDLTRLSSGSLSSNASAVDSSPQPLLPAIRATEMSFGSGGRESSKCIPATGIAARSGTLYDVDTAGVTCQTRVIPVSATLSSGPVTHTATVSISGRPITVTYVDNPHLLASTTPGRPSTVSFEAASEPHHVNTASSRPLSSSHGTLPANAPSATPAEYAHVGAPGYKFL